MAIRPDVLNDAMEGDLQGRGQYDLVARRCIGGRGTDRRVGNRSVKCCGGQCWKDRKIRGLPEFVGKVARHYKMWLYVRDGGATLRRGVRQ